MWNTVVEEFAATKQVSFADINLATDSIRGPPHHPGQGGWPTIRYFNAETGLDGAGYVQKTTKSVCDELGPGEDYLRQWIRQVAGVGGCQVDGTDCSEREMEYLTKWRDKAPTEMAAQLERLSSMRGSAMKADLKDWLQARWSILQRLQQAVAVAEQEL